MSFDFETLDNSRFIICKFEDIDIGDIIRINSMTYSQKYFYIPEYNELNCQKVGILIEKNNDDPPLSKLNRYNYNTKTFDIINLYIDLKTSGTIIIEKYICS